MVNKRLIVASDVKVTPIYYQGKLEFVRSVVNRQYLIVKYSTIGQSNIQL